jgi:2-amino-4-hydroxy-6-hydroxymethyldihydropteridine diphosphokinase
MCYYLSLGSNLGDREQTLRLALQRIEQQIGVVLRCSSFYYSAPWGFQSDNDFCNLCCAVETTKSPLEVLSLTQSIEQALGRTRKSINGNYSDRPIDIDLIRIFDGEKELYLSLPELTIPHPFWQDRDFVKLPLAEILP